MLGSGSVSPRSRPTARPEPVTDRLPFAATANPRCAVSTRACLVDATIYSRRHGQNTERGYGRDGRGFQERLRETARRAAAASHARAQRRLPAALLLPALALDLA